MATIFGLIGWMVPYSAFNLYEHSFYIGIGAFTFVLVSSYFFLVTILKNFIRSGPGLFFSNGFRHPISQCTQEGATRKILIRDVLMRKVLNIKE